MKFTDNEIATILAALRSLQEDMKRVPSLTRQRLQFVDHKPLTSEEIDDLCVRINLPNSKLGSHSENIKIACELADLVVEERYGGERWKETESGDQCYTDEAQEYFSNYYEKYMNYLEPGER